MLSLHEARRLAAEAEPIAPRRVPLAEAVGLICAQDVFARLDIPHVSTSAMDGWAVSVPKAAVGWSVIPQSAEGPADMLPPLRPGEAAGVVTGSPMPEGALSVLREEHSAYDEGAGILTAEAHTPDLDAGRNIRPRGVEAAEGDRLLSAGSRITPARAAAAAVAGHDELLAHPNPSVRLILTGSEVITSGMPQPGQVRDVFGVALPGMLAGLGIQQVDSVRLRDDVDAMRAELGSGSEDVLITTGGTAHSRADTLRPALEQLGARIVVDSVDMRPGHPALLARLGERWILGLPGNPLAGFAALAALGAPLLAALAGRAEPSIELTAAEQLIGARRGLRVLPVRRTPDGIRAAGHSKSHMMRGLAEAELFALVPPEGVDPGRSAECLQVPGAFIPLRHIPEEQ
ncbi:molybdopterin molybdotransferase MoeA [Nesterenkonia sp. NBAIMH1]|uniref:molybdopterin molybdotransferase MoeA n=1 Tax=Nesterenkonia sp. NBAIMH1 TaxID=2600320 RepID=UPI0011B72E8A|nr:molybdopterin molybdotransferase MoeA [Nesterenkonia sp. NBAIMH1]